MSSRTLSFKRDRVAINTQQASDDAISEQSDHWARGYESEEEEWKSTSRVS